MDATSLGTIVGSDIAACIYSEYRATRNGPRRMYILMTLLKIYRVVGIFPVRRRWHIYKDRYVYSFIRDKLTDLVHVAD